MPRETFASRSEGYNFFLLYGISTKAMVEGGLKHLGHSGVEAPRGDLYVLTTGAHHSLGWEHWEAATIPCGTAAISLNGHE